MSIAKAMMILYSDEIEAAKSERDVARAARRRVAKANMSSVPKYVTVSYKYDGAGEYTGEYSISPTKYYNEEVFTDDVYYSKAQKTLAEDGYKLLEIHSMNALNRTEEHNKAGTPEPGFGNNNWCRIVVENKRGKKMTSAWVFRDDAHSAARYASRGACNCANLLYSVGAFRLALLGSLRLDVNAH